MRDDWSALRKLMFQRMAAGGRLIEDTVTGNPAVFQTNVAKPLTGFTIPFLPMQSGSGDPSPSNVRPIIGWQGLTAWRTGENLFDKSNNEEILQGKNFTQNGGIEGSANAVTVCIPCKPNTKYTASKVATKRGAFAYVTTPSIPVNGTPVYGYVSFQGTTATITTGDDATYLLAYLVNTTYETNLTKQDVIDSCQIEVGETASPYAPYTGASYPVIFPAQGKNLLPNKTKVRGATSIYIGQDEENVYPIHLVAGNTYTLSFTHDGTKTAQGYIQAENGAAALIGTGNTQTFTASETVDVRFYIYVSGGVTTITDFMLNEGSTALPYEPFTNTVYGGTVYPLDGRMLVEYEEKALDSFLYYYGNNGFFVSYNTFKFSDRTKFVCNAYKVVSLPYWDSMPDLSIMGTPMDARDVVRIRDTNYEDVTQFKAHLTEIGAKLVYPLPTPYEIPLDPITIQTLLGDNVIWTDTNGSNTIKYKKKG